MPSKPDAEQKKKMGRQRILTGNWGEQYISEKLSSCDCYVRHVPQGHDTGIDLYCETTSDDKHPFLHFWCQVKTEKFKGRNSQVTLKQQSREDYWLKQPIPVFIFRVPDLRNEDIPKKGMIPFYIFNAIDSHDNEERIKSFLKIEKLEDLNSFLKKDLLIQTFRWDLMKGRVSHLLTSEPSYTIEFLNGHAIKFEKKLQKSLRWTLRLLADDILNQEDSESLSRAKPYVEMLDVLASSIDDKHYETYRVIGKYYRKQNDCEEALKKYRKSLELLNEDTKISRDCEQWKQVFECIETTIRELESGTTKPDQSSKMSPRKFSTMATNGGVTIFK